MELSGRGITPFYSTVYHAANIKEGITLIQTYIKCAGSERYVTLCWLIELACSLNIVGIQYFR